MSPVARPLLAPTPFITVPDHARQHLSSADWQLVHSNWNDHQRNFPGMTPEKFLQILVEREQFFREERYERQIKLARLQASIRPLP